MDLVRLVNIAYKIHLQELIVHTVLICHIQVQDLVMIVYQFLQVYILRELD